MLIIIHIIFYITNLHRFSGFIKMTKDRPASNETFLYKYGIL